MYEVLRMAHLIMIAMGTGLAISYYVMLRAGAGHDVEADRGLVLGRRALADMMSMVLVFIWITGLTQVWSGQGHAQNPLNAWFYAKLAFVGLLTVAHVMERLTATGFAGDAPRRQRLVERWASLVWLSALMAICLAVISFAP